MNEMSLFRHQEQLIRAPWERPDISNFFLIGGYSAGKSFGDVALILEIARRYNGWPVKVGIFAPTLGFLEKTMVAELITTLERTGLKYRYNGAKNTVKIGTVEFVMLSTEQPHLIYGHNFSISISDEHDELEQTKAMLANVAIQERTRIPLPDGRDAFTVYSTTAQGFKGVYQIIQELDKAGRAYVLIRGKTIDNTTLKPDFIARLWALYNENERLAFLEGQFVNLTSGRVYPEFDERKHKIAPFEIDPWETVFIGQDLNEGYSKATAFILRERKAIGIKEWSFAAIGRAPETFRHDFPRNRILWYPDNSGKPVLGGYADEAEANDIELVWTGRNPSILDRIFIVNKLFKVDRLQLFENMEEYPMALKTRGFDKHGVPEKGQGTKSPDHICDSAEMCLFWMVANQEEFMDLYELTPSARKEE